jgi:hypothetical protein
MPRTIRHRRWWLTVTVALLVVGSCAGSPPSQAVQCPNTQAPTPWAPPTQPIPPGAERMMAVTAYHLDLWDRQAAEIDALIQQGDAEGTADAARSIEANGLAWGWAMRHSGKIELRYQACWSGYRDLVTRMANGLSAYGSFLQESLQSQRDRQWYDHNVTGSRGIFDRNRANLAGQQTASIACQQGGPIPSDPPFITDP